MKVTRRRLVGVKLMLTYVFLGGVLGVAAMKLHLLDWLWRSTL